MTDTRGSGGRWEAPRWLRTALLAAIGLGIVAVLVYAAMPQAVPVDVVTIDRGTFEVAVEEDGRTRVRHRFVLTAPVNGTLRRVELRAGDPVTAGQVLAQIDGPEPGIPDPRTAEQLRIRLSAAEARIQQAEAFVQTAEVGLGEAQEELRRLEVLLPLGGASESARDRARSLVRAREADVASATSGVLVAEREAQDLRAALSRPGTSGATLELHSPVDGVLLRVHRESGGSVAPGEPLVELGDPAGLEVVVDLLSADAVRVPDGAAAVITGWGGEAVLNAHVRTVEPAGFTRVSALGIEEQRVNVVLDPVADDPGWTRLGDGFQVDARIILDRAVDVLRVSTAALFRTGGGWAVFRVVEGRAVETPIGLGRRSQAEAEVLSGLESGDQVVVYPSDRVVDGVRIDER